MDRLRIAFVVHDYHRNGGHARYVAELSTRYCRDHEVHVFANTFEESADVTIHSHHVPALRSNALATILSFVVPVSWQLMRAGHFDIVHSQGFCGLSQNVMTAHISQTGWFAAVQSAGQRQSLRKKVFRSIVQWLERRAYQKRAAKQFIAVSYKLKNELALYHGLDDQVVVIHHGIDTATFHPDNRARDRQSVRSEHAIDDSQCVALYVGDWQKAGISLLHSLQSTESVHLMVVTKTNRSIVQREIDQANLTDRVTLVEPTREIYRYYAASDMFVFPSYYDTFGMVVAEAMASGLPAIVSRQTGASEWILNDQNGIIVESASDAGSFSQAMNRLAKDPALRSAIGEAARSTTIEHSWDRVAIETMDVYRRVLNMADRV